MYVKVNRYAGSIQVDTVKETTTKRKCSWPMGHFILDRWPAPTGVKIYLRSPRRSLRSWETYPNIVGTCLIVSDMPEELDVLIKAVFTRKANWVIAYSWLLEYNQLLDEEFRTALFQFDEYARESPLITTSTE